MDKKALMDSFVREAHEKGVFTGTWLYAENGEIVSKGAVGFRDPADTLPMQEDSIFELASVSKQFTAAAIMLLRKRGLLSLDDELSKYFPQNPYPGITIRHMLNHTSGIPDHEEWSVDVLKNETVIPKNDLCVRFLRESGLPPLFAPGEKYEYSNTAYCLLAEIIEQVAGVPFEDFMRKEIFEPAGMFSTRVCHIRIDGVPFENFARGLVFSGGSYVIPDELEEYRSSAVMLDGESGDGFVYSNIFDMLAWDKTLREETLLSLEEQQMMYTPAVLNSGEDYRDEDGDSYGFGWCITKSPQLGLVVSHGGGWPGYTTWFERGVDTDRTLVVLCSREAEDIRGFVGFFEGMKAIASDQEPEPLKTVEDIAVKSPDTSQWENYCGKYEHPEDDFIIDEVFMKDGDLYADAINDEGDQIQFRLYPTDENTFARKGGFVQITFDGDSITYAGSTCKKL